MFTIVARHFVDEDELVKLLRQDRDVDEDKARGLVRQVSEAGYSPPLGRHDPRLRGQAGLPDPRQPDDPDAGNVYRDLDFPDEVYESISAYHEEKATG